MITADTITDEQIRALLESLRLSGTYECNRCGHEQLSPVQCGVCGWGDLYWTRRDDMRACYAAIAVEIGVSKWTRETARARCAEILNSRSVAPWSHHTPEGWTGPDPFSWHSELQITAENVTDEQIRSVWTSGHNDITGRELMAAMREPLWDGHVWNVAEVHAARIRCAEILNARGGK